jgi:hypothetical protein
MNLLDAETLIQTYLASNWTATKIAYPNVLPADFTAPGQPLLPEGTADYIALRYQFENSRFITVPGTCRRYTGQIQITAFVRRQTGTRTLATYANSLIELFEGKEIKNTGNEILRVWGLTGSIELAYDDWYARELAFAASFERQVT